MYSSTRTSPYLAAVGASLVIASIAIGASARVSALAAVIAILGLPEILRTLNPPPSDRAGGCQVRSLERFRQ